MSMPMIPDGDPPDGTEIAVLRQAGRRKRFSLSAIGHYIITALAPPKGDKGDKGDEGSAATVAVGTVATGAAGSSAAVVNAGNSSAAVLNFTIPRGDKGNPGNPAPVYTSTEISGTVSGGAGNGTIPITGFASVLFADFVITWSGDQMISGRVTALTTTSVSAAVRRSRGTLALSSGPFEVAPNGAAFTIRVVGVAS